MSLRDVVSGDGCTSDAGPSAPRNAASALSDALLRSRAARQDLPTPVPAAVAAEQKHDQALVRGAFGPGEWGREAGRGGGGGGH